ncbi:copper fist DNA binding domain-containing protein [Choanephora cucurbitarum]|nr:copper fist DNA binding domain-containing protein [Choanephora cucurbitarum]
MFINGIKFACNTCVKGHRSSNCNHFERPLIEIRKKGRPVTQCSFCRDLRKTKQVHVKCNCTDKSESRLNNNILCIRNILYKSINIY